MEDTRTITKRDGRVVPFNAEFIYNAVLAAYSAGYSGRITTDEVRRHFARNVTDHVVKALADVPNLTVEYVQDVVERVLMDLEPQTAKGYILYRQKKAEMRAIKPDPNMIGDYIHPAKYGRYIKELGRRETYNETVQRVCKMHATMFRSTLDSHRGFMEEVDDAFMLVANKSVLPSMRSMQFAGDAILRGQHARIYNCSFTHCNRWTAFSDTLYLLLCGCGVGYSVQKHHVAMLPPIAKMPKKGKRVVHHRVSDDIEGWAEAMRLLFVHAYRGEFVEFDYSAIRPEGAELKTSGGFAPGHLPLRVAIERIRKILRGAQGRKLTPLECHDSMCFLADCVLAGGVRRSSLIAIFSFDDEEMLLCKQSDRFRYPFGDDHGLNSQRRLANNSAIILRSDPHRREKLGNLLRLSLANYGDPGFFLSNSLEYGTNPCGEIGLEPTLYRQDIQLDDDKPSPLTGRSNGDICWGLNCQTYRERNPGCEIIPGQLSGFAFCNLTEINGALCKSPEEFWSACEAASVIGTLQAAYTDFGPLGGISSFIAQRDALLGVGITGMCDSPDVLFDAETLRHGADIVNRTNARIAEMIGINVAARTTTVKPSGTTSLELNCVGSGIHPHHAKRYFRRITANPTEPVAQLMRKVNPHMVDEMPNGDWSICFPVMAPENAETVKEQPARKFLDRVHLVYQNWIVPGTVRDRSGLTHNVSATLVAPKEELPEVVLSLTDRMDEIAAMAFFERMSDKGIPFIPREEVLPEDESRWRHLISNYKPVDYSHEKYEEQVDRVFDSACSGDKCEVDFSK